MRRESAREMKSTLASSVLETVRREKPLVLVADLRGAIGFSSFGVLIYYAVANLEKRNCLN